MKKIKKYIGNLISFIYSIRSFSNHNKLINKKIEVLKKKGSFQRFPISYNKTIVGNHSILKFPNDLKWFDYFYSINGITSDTYIPLNLFYSTIEPILNHRLMVSTLKDKNFYELFYKNANYPKVLIRRINSFYYDGNYEPIKEFKTIFNILEKKELFIVKASLDSGSGKSIYLFKKENGVFKSDNVCFDESFLRKIKIDFVIQEFVKQHSFYRKFNTSSNNTIRVMTYRSVIDDSLIILHTLLRIGAKDSFLDHDNLGGVSISIKEDNRLNEFAYDGKGNKYHCFNNITFKKVGEAPFIDKIKDYAIKVATKTYYGRLLALDFTIDENEKILLLDLNCWRNGITHYQLNNGTLFGKYSKEILDYCSRNKSFNVIRIPIR